MTKLDGAQDNFFPITAQYVETTNLQKRSALNDAKWNDLFWTVACYACTAGTAGKKETRGKILYHDQRRQILKTRLNMNVADVIVVITSHHKK